MDGDIIVLVGNIGVKKNIVTYINDGVEGLSALYEERQSFTHSQWDCKSIPSPFL